MSNVLMIMNGREIPQCIRAFQELKIAKAWFKGYTEGELQIVINRFVQESNYNNYILASDDLVPTQQALNVVIEGLEEYPVLTGYCNWTPTSDRVNVRLHPYRGNLFTYVAANGLTQTLWLMQKLNWETFARRVEISELPDYFQTWFMGNTFTGMRRDLWLDFPFQCYRNRFRLGKFDRWMASDYSVSRRLARKNVTMMCAKKGFFYHLASRENLIVGKVKPSIRMDY